MRTTAWTQIRIKLAAVSLAVAELLLAAAVVHAQEPAPSSPLSAGSAVISYDYSADGIATRVGDARPWLAETSGTRLWINPEYLLWNVRRGPLPGVLVTTSSAAGPNAGIPGDPTTAVLFGGHDIRYGLLDGARLTVGLMSDSMPFSLDINVFGLEQKHDHFQVQSNPFGSPVIAIPVSLFGGPTTAIHVSDPNNFSGGVHIDSAISLWGSETNAMRAWFVDSSTAVNVIAGLRFLELSESFKMATDSHDVNSGASFFSFDSFGTRNRFYGLQLGANLVYRQDRLSIMAFNKLALGETETHIAISGMRTGAAIPSNSLATAGFLATPSAAGGILTSPSNVGTFNRDCFSVVDEIGINAAFEVFDGVAVTGGASFLFWGDVVRPGDQVTTIVAPAGTTRPANGIIPGRSDRDSDFWAYGLNLGLEFRY